MKSTFFIKHFRTALATAGLLLFAFQGASQFGYALTFTQASSQYVTVPHSSSINLGATFTLEAIVNYTGINSTIVDKGDYDFLWELNANANGSKLGFYNGATATWVYSTAPVPQGVTTHVAVVGSGGTVTFYINGVASGGGTATARQDNQPMNIGRQQPTSCQCNHFNGTMDELRIWNVARTQAQIVANITSSVPVNSAGLVAYYKFDEGGGTTTTDASGNANNGTLVNGPTWANTVSGGQGGVGIGTSTPSINAALDISSTSKGLMLPRLSDTSAVTNPSAGLLIYNNNTREPAFHNGSSWQSFLNPDNSNVIDPNSDSIVYVIGPNNAGLAAGPFRVQDIQLGGSFPEPISVSNIVIPFHLNSIGLQKQLMQETTITGEMEVRVFKKGSPAARYTYKFTDVTILASSFGNSTGSLAQSVSYTIKANKMSYKDVVNNISFGWRYVAPVGLTTY
ncbi:MAG: LamG domain-containing protein [Bacteroidota bacterium]